MTKDTQLEAFEAIKPKLPERRRQVIQLLLKGDSYLHEIAASLRIPVHSASGTLTDLEKIGVIKDSGRRAVNPTSGRRCVVWTLTGEFEKAADRREKAVQTRFVRQLLEENERLRERIALLETKKRRKAGEEVFNNPRQIDIFRS